MKAGDCTFGPTDCVAGLDLFRIAGPARRPAGREGYLVLNFSRVAGEMLESALSVSRNEARLTPSAS
jgi:hypothetical protein